jgi:hypothetical protein
MGKGSWVYLGSKYKSIKWSKFWGERLLAAANSDERERARKSQDPHPENPRVRHPSRTQKTFVPPGRVSELRLTDPTRKASGSMIVY